MRIGLKSMFFRYSHGNNGWNQGELETEITRLNLSCCQRDSSAFQIVLWDREDFLLTINQDTLFWKKGPVNIARIEVKLEEALQMTGGIRTDLRIIGLIQDDDGCYKSDLLLDQKQIFVERMKIQQIWVECHAGENVKPGRYWGKVMLYSHSMFEDEKLQAECSFQLDIKDHCLPKSEDYQFYLDLWQHNSNIARKYDVDIWSDAHFEIMDNYLHSMAQLGQKSASLIVSEIPWSGQFTHQDREPSDFFEYSIISVIKDRNGKFSYDYTALDRYVEMARRHGIHAEIELFGLLNIWQDEQAGYGSIVQDYPDGIRIRYYDEAVSVFRFIRDSEGVAAYIRALEAHFIEKEWIHLVRVLADEPSDIPLFSERLARLQQIAPRFKYKLALNHASFIEHNIEGIHDYVPVLECAVSEYDRWSELKPHIKGKLLYYVCCHPNKPNTFIGSDPLECRIIPWLAEQLKLDGFLRWNYTVWPDDPIHAISYRSPIWPAGDTNFVYPGKRGKPLLSLRYKWLQRGIRDFEIMQQLKFLGKGDRVESYLNQVFHFHNNDHIGNFLNFDGLEGYSLLAEDYDRLVNDL